MPTIAHVPPGIVHGHPLEEATFEKVPEKVYATGRKCTAGFKKSMKIVFDSFLPKWNYRAVPEPL